MWLGTAEGNGWTGPGHRAMGELLDRWTPGLMEEQMTLIAIKLSYDVEKTQM